MLGLVLVYETAEEENSSVHVAPKLFQQKYTLQWNQSKKNYLKVED